ncbi:MAG: hypothetical protein EOO50_16145 [Flavobacterium sp.]|uniref:hypothetical protein n=1 Tax=Flavobacterium sp. TaxID=239 RepID=UPI0011FE31A3|nr:hypothetical protein [Flavobacterium sp.]RZJ64287.1 MAG: hypothetical protein EOO50_16145 [Flavobacterium sp.]
MKKNIMAIALLASAAMQAQTFTWSQPEPLRGEIESDVTHLVDTKLYRIVSRYNENLFNQDVNVDTYNIVTLKKDRDFDLSVEQPPMGKAMITHLAMFEENKTQQLIFLDEYDNKTKERVLYGQHVNLVNGQKDNTFKITGMPGRNSEYIIAQSQEKNFYAVIKRFTLDKKENEKINVTLIDKSGKVVNEISYQTPYQNKAKSVEFELSVSDDGKVYVVRNIDLAKQIPFRSLFYWDGKSAEMTETSLKLQNDHQLYYTKGWFDGGNFYLQGFCTRVGAKFVQLHRGNNPVSAVYVAKFDSNNKNVYTELNEVPETGLRVKEIMHESGKTYIVADKMVEIKKAKPMKQNSFELEYSFAYSNTEIILAKIDDATGKLEWFNKIPFSEIDTQFDNGKFLSFLYILKNGEFTILYDDRDKFEIKDGDKTRSTFDRFIIMETFGTDGKQKSQRKLEKTGLEPRWDFQEKYWLEDFDLDTSVIVKVRDGEYIVRSASGQHEKYGYLTF